MVLTYPLFLVLDCWYTDFRVTMYVQCVDNGLIRL